MNNKPVAWMMVNRENTSAYLTFETPTRDMKISHEPYELYTHQYERPHNTVLVPCDKLAEMQAELAILRKAQEK